MIVIAATGAKQCSRDAALSRCVTAKSLIPNANDAMTQMTQDSTVHFRGRLNGIQRSSCN